MSLAPGQHIERQTQWGTCHTQHTPIQPSSTHVLPSHLRICNFRDPQWANEYLAINLRTPPPSQSVQMGGCLVLLGDSEARRRSAYYGGCTRYIAASQEIEAPVCSRVRRKTTVAIKQLIKRFCKKDVLGPSPFRPGKPVNSVQSVFVQGRRIHEESSTAPSAAMPSVACVGRHSNGFCLFRGDRKWLFCPQAGRLHIPDYQSVAGWTHPPCQGPPHINSGGNSNLIL